MVEILRILESKYHGESEMESKRWHPQFSGNDLSDHCAFGHKVTSTFLRKLVSSPEERRYSFLNVKVVG